MADCVKPINIIPNNNTVKIVNANNTIEIIDHNCCNTVKVEQPVTSVVQVLTGPLGLTGNVGPSGSQGPSGSSAPFTFVSGNIWNTTSSIEITGSLTISGSSTFKNIGPAIFSGSVISTQGFTGSLLGTSSYTITALYALNSGGASINTGSFATTGSNTFVGNQIINGENLGLIVDASGLNRVGFMKYGGIEGSIARVANQNFRILRTTGNDINDGTNAITDFYIAGDGKVGIGTSTPAYTLDVSGSSNFIGNTIISGSNNFILGIHGVNDIPWAFGIYNDTYNPSQSVLAGWINNTGEANVGTEVDKPLYIYTNANYGSPTLTISSSGVTINNDTTISGSLNVSGSITLNNVTGDLRPYKVFTGLLTQTANNPPVITELENTLGSNLSITYQGTGDYMIYSTSSFTANKTFTFIGPSANGLNYPEESGFKQIQYVDEARLNIKCVNTSYQAVDVVLGNTPFEIRVYN